MTRPPVELHLAERDGRQCLHIRRGAGHSPLSVLPSELVGRADAWQPVAGRFDEQDGDVWFVPRYPLVPGLSYSLLIGGVEAASIELPVPIGESTTDVVSIHPSAEEVPLNLLRVYVSFSAPMREGCAGRVGFRRADTGEPLAGVFLPMDPELWDGSRQRLTLLLDPGRIKRGLAPNAEAGYPLADGARVSVVVDPSFRDASGRPLRAQARRRYRVGPAVRMRVDPHAWRLEVPRSESAAALVVVFDRPLDWALLRRCLVVVDGAMAPVPGAASIGEGEGSWRFAPTAAWAAGSYTLRVDARLEDVAGNSVRRVFDRELDLPEHEPLDLERVDLTFTVA